MTHNQKVDYTRMALSMAGITANEMASETIITIIEQLQLKAGNFTVRDATRIASKIQEKYKRKAKASSKS